MHEERLSKYVRNSYTIKRTGNLRSLFKIKTLRSRVTSLDWASQEPLEGVIFRKCNGAAEGKFWVLNRHIWFCLYCLCLSNRDSLFSPISKSQIVTSLSLFSSFMTKIRVIKWSLKNIVYIQLQVSNINHCLCWSFPSL